MSSNNKKPTKLNGDDYTVDKRLGSGCFGEVYRGKDKKNNFVAIKFEDLSNATQQLEHEKEILKILWSKGAPQGFAQVFYAGPEGKYYCMVMELLGKSLEDRLSSCNGKFTVLTTVLIADQVLRRIEFLHSKGIIHRDIKPENFMFGVKEKVHHLYLIDFGLSKRIFNETKHLQPRSKLSLTGTARYASINAHKGLEQSRRDDLEAIGHMLIYFLRGSLPWSGLNAQTQEEKYRKIKETKEETPLDKLCEGYPKAFEKFLRIARGLEFKDRPDYEALRELFMQERKAIEAERKKKPGAEKAQITDYHFQWLVDEQGHLQDNLGTLVPLIRELNLKQPDDEAVKSPFWRCFTWRF